MKSVPPSLRDDFQRDPPYPPDYLFPQQQWSGLGDLDDLRFLERRLRAERLIPLSYVRLRERLGFALLTMDMQNRWKQEYQQAQKRNKQAVELVREAARSLPQQRVLLLLALDAFCTLYPDPGVRPSDGVEILVENHEGFEAYREVLAKAAAVAPRPSGPGRAEFVLDGEFVLTLSSDVTRGGITMPVQAMFARARPASETPAPPHDGLAITQGAPKLTTDATKTAQDAARGVVPGRPRPAGARSASSDEDVQSARIEDAPSVLLMCREHALLLALLEWATRAPGRRPGLYAWELGEMTRRWAFDWDTFTTEVRRQGFQALIDAVLQELSSTWRFQMPSEVRARLRGGALGHLMIRFMGPVRAQRVLQNPILRRL